MIITVNAYEDFENKIALFTTLDLVIHRLNKDNIKFMYEYNGNLHKNIIEYCIKNNIDIKPVKPNWSLGSRLAMFDMFNKFAENGVINIVFDNEVDQNIKQFLRILKNKKYGRLIRVYHEC